MYAGHEITNPEYWYDQMKFAFMFIGIALAAFIYPWHRNVVVIWLGDGL